MGNTGDPHKEHWGLLWGILGTPCEGHWGPHEEHWKLSCRIISAGVGGSEIFCRMGSSPSGQETHHLG